MPADEDSGSGGEGAGHHAIHPRLRGVTDHSQAVSDARCNWWPGMTMMSGRKKRTY